MADLEVAEQMIKHFIRKAQGEGRKLRRAPEIVICVPSNSTQAERRAIRDGVSNAGARQVWLINEPLAAVIDAGLPVAEPVGQIVHVADRAGDHPARNRRRHDGYRHTMTGGGSLLPEIAQVIAQASRLPVVVADDPLKCLALGAGRPS